MAKRILVPLDGTEETVAGLDLIADAARGGGAVVRLLRVAPAPENVLGVLFRAAPYRFLIGTRGATHEVQGGLS